MAKAAKTKKQSKPLGMLVREARVKKNMTQLELANALGYESMQFVSLFERGLSKIPLKVIGKIIVILGMDYDEIVADLVAKEKQRIEDTVYDGIEAQEYGT